VSTPTARDGMPRWVKLLLIGLAVLIALSLVWLALNTLGGHGHKS
jgi:hypothetical protein